MAPQRIWLRISLPVVVRQELPSITSESKHTSLQIAKSYDYRTSTVIVLFWGCRIPWVAVISAKNHKRQNRKRQSVTAKREKLQTPKILTAKLTLPNPT